MSKAIQRLTTEEITKTATTIQEIADEYSVEKIAQLPNMLQVVRYAEAMRAMREAMTEAFVEVVFMPLQGTRLGFRTDKDRDGGYPALVVRDVMIDAMLRGFRPVGNEVNVIAGNAYYTKEAFERKVAEFPGLTDLEIEAGVPHSANGGALVPYSARWKLEGQRGEMHCQLMTDGDGKVLSDTRIPVRVNSGMGSDAILGKAKRKFLARLYERLSGVKTPDDEVNGDPDAIDTVGEAAKVDKQKQGVEGQVDELVNKHKAKAAAKQAEGNGEVPPDDEPPPREPGEEG